MVSGFDLVFRAAGEHNFGVDHVGEGPHRRGQPVGCPGYQRELDAYSANHGNLGHAIMHKVGGVLFMPRGKIEDLISCGNSPADIRHAKRNSTSIVIASRFLMATTGGGSLKIESQLDSTARITSTAVAGVFVGASLTAIESPWLSSGLLTLVSPSLARKLFGRVTTLWVKVRSWVERQLVSTTRPSVPSLRTIQSPSTLGSRD